MSLSILRRSNLNELSFAMLRAANMARLPEFKNKHGQPAHAKSDGSDWSPAQWVQALLGELGEFAEVRLQFEGGLITRDEYTEKAAKELADIQAYLDILALRALDAVLSPVDSATYLLRAISELGRYANIRKKFDRGDCDAARASHEALMAQAEVGRAMKEVVRLADLPSSTRTVPHPHGVDLGAATAKKWNEVSERVGCELQLRQDLDGQCLVRYSQGW